MTLMTFQLFRTSAGDVAVFENGYNKVKQGDIISNSKVSVKVKHLLLPTMKTVQNNEQAAVVEIIEE